MSLQAEAVRNWYQFPDKISFLLEVAGKKVTAALYSATYVIDPQFAIEFSDGHKDVYSIQDWKIYNSDNRSDAYSRALEGEIHSPLFSWAETKPVACIPVEINAEEMNAWIVWYNKGDSVPGFDVFIKNSRPLTITKKANEWEIIKTRSGIPIRKIALDKIKASIEKMINREV